MVGSSLGMGAGKARNLEMIKEIAEDIAENFGSYVFVIGAGASASVGVPVSSQLKAEFTRGFQEEMKARVDKERAERQEPMCKSLNEVAMEELLPIYAEIVGGDNPIERFLKGHLERFGGREKFPPLGYEVLGHMMNLGLVKHIVSMNFDELLETALDEEIGDSNYLKVRSKPEFVKLLEDEESNQEELKISKSKILLKPHGTISLSATLRANLDGVFRFEKEKFRALEKVFREKNVIFVGYSFLDPDLRKLIWSLFNSRELRKIYFVDMSKNLRKGNLHIDELLLHTQKGYGGGFICEESDKFFGTLGLEIEKTENGKYLPKIARHIIRSLIFKNGNFEPSLENKLLVEILIYSLKVQGKFKTKALLSCERIKYLSEELRRKRRAEDSASVQMVLQKLKSAGSLLVVTEGQEGSGRIYDIGDETYYLIGTQRKRAGKEHTALDEIVKNIIKNLPKLLRNSSGKLDGALGKLMKDLATKFDYDLITGLHPFEYSFRFPVHKEDPIEFRKSQIALEILRKAFQENTSCYIIAETGEWMLDENVLAEYLKPEKVMIILSDYRKDPLNSLHRARAKRVCADLMKKIGPKKNIRFLDWNLNKHHGTFSYSKCIYFYKDGKPSILQPVVLTDKEDTQRLLDLCSYLWGISSTFSFSE
jgi:hypothetical protein